MYTLDISRGIGIALLASFALLASVEVEGILALLASVEVEVEVLPLPLLRDN
jgi:hypothetical protein